MGGYEYHGNNSRGGDWWYIWGDIVAKEYAVKFYKSKAWQQCRDAYYNSKFGMCERCGEPGVIVHHKKYITPDNINDPNITLSFGNLELLCIGCHDREHFRGSPTVAGTGFDADGNFIKL